MLVSKTEEFRGIEINDRKTRRYNSVITRLSKLPLTVLYVAFYADLFPVLFLHRLITVVIESVRIK